VKFQIQRELGAKPETSKAANGTNYAPGLTEWLVRTLLLVSAEEFSDGRPPERLHVETSPLTILSRRSSTPSQLLKNGAFDGRREIYPDHSAIWMGVRNRLLEVMGSLQHPTKSGSYSSYSRFVISHMSSNPNDLELPTGSSARAETRSLILSP
jgi:hypothetical protein